MAASTSRNHRLRVLTEQERAASARGLGCTRRCAQPAVAKAEFEFVTGRAGRIGSRSSDVCAAHAQAFADKHEIPNPLSPQNEA